MANFAYVGTCACPHGRSFNPRTVLSSQDISQSVLTNYIPGIVPVVISESRSTQAAALLQLCPLSMRGQGRMVWTSELSGSRLV